MLAPSPGLAVLLTTLVALGPLSTDLYLPSLPSLAQSFGTDAARVQLTLSVFLAGFALAQLAYGPLSDRYGRRPVMLGGLLIYLLSSVACLLAPSVEALIAARFFQAVGACAGPVLARAVVRDVYGPVQAAKVLAYVSGAMAIAPMVGPALGGFLTVWFGWRANFAVLTLFSALQLVAVALMLGESNAHPDPTATRPRRMLANFAGLFGTREYVGFAVCFAASYAIIFSFISGSSFLLIDVLGLSPQLYGASFGFAVAGYIVGTVISGKRLGKVGVRRMVLYGALVEAVAGTMMTLLAAAGVSGLWAVLVPMFLCMLGAGLAMPSAIGGALAPYPKMTGAASALVGFVQMGAAALVGAAVGHAYDGSALPMAIAIALCGWVVLAAWWLAVRQAAAS